MRGRMEEKNYTALLQAKGCKPVLKYGIACHKKKCRVVMQELLYHLPAAQVLILLGITLRYEEFLSRISGGSE